MTEIEVQRIVLEMIAMLFVMLMIAFIVVFGGCWLIDKYVDWERKRWRKKYNRDLIDKV